MKYSIIILLSVAVIGYSRDLDGLGNINDMPRLRPDAPSRQPHSREQRFAAEREQAEKIYRAAKEDLGFILKSVAQNKEIDEDKLEEINRSFRAARQGFRFLDRQQQSNMMLIEAWTLFFESADAEQALRRAERASALHPTNGDAYASTVIFSLLSGQPVRSKEMYLRRVQRRRDEPAPQMSDSVIEVNIPDTAKGFIGSKMPISPAALMNKADDEDIYFCALLWTLSPEEIDDQTKAMLNAARGTLTPEQAEMAQRFIESESISSEDVKKEVLAFSSLYENNTAKDKFIFISLNVDDIDKLEEFKQEHELKPAPLSASMLPGVGEEIREAIKLLGYMMIISDASGSIKYAGGVDCFLPVMLINNLVPNSQKPIETASNARRQRDFGRTPPADEYMFFDDMPEDAPRAEQPPADSNSLPTENLSDFDDELTDAQRHQNTQELKPEQRDQAERLLESARMFRGSHTRLGSSRRVVENCLEVIEKFPGTTYEKEAREILSTIPEHQRRRHGIED